LKERVDFIGILILPAQFAPNMVGDKLKLIPADRLLLLIGLLDVVANMLNAMLGAAELRIAA
jgi:hypothetical protein